MTQQNGSGKAAVLVDDPDVDAIGEAERAKILEESLARTRAGRWGLAVVAWVGLTIVLGELVHLPWWHWPAAAAVVAFVLLSAYAVPAEASSGRVAGIPSARTLGREIRPPRHVRDREIELSR